MAAPSGHSAIFQFGSPSVAQSFAFGILRHFSRPQKQPQGYKTNPAHQSSLARRFEIFETYVINETVFRHHPKNTALRNSVILLVTALKNLRDEQICAAGGNSFSRALRFGRRGRLGFPCDSRRSPGAHGGSAGNHPANLAAEKQIGVQWLDCARLV